MIRNMEAKHSYQLEFIQEVSGGYAKLSNLYWGRGIRGSSFVEVYSSTRCLIGANVLKESEREIYAENLSWN